MSGSISYVSSSRASSSLIWKRLKSFSWPGNGLMSLFLAAVAVLPSLFITYGGFSQATGRALGGTSVLIAVGVALDTMRQMESQMMMRNYEAEQPRRRAFALPEVAGGRLLQLKQAPS